MLDYQRIVDDVRGALFNNADASDDFLQSAAADYSLAIDEVNQRLSACSTLLRKGLRSEAIQLCEVEPNLLEAVETLDFPEHDSWKELLALRGLSHPAPLMLDAAANLNEAYAIEQPLATLLSRHRLLAMSRGPMKHRVETLRSLANADPENPIWEQDLRSYETARIKELQREVPEAIAGGDGAALASLSAELENSPWRIDRPQMLIQQIAVARSNAARLQGLNELRRAADQLGKMHTAGDVAGGNAARAKWEQLFAAWGQFAGPPLVAQVAPVLSWLDEQKEQSQRIAQQEQAVALLQQGLAARKGTSELERLHHEAQREGQIPPDLEERYQKRLADIDRAARRKLHITLAVLACFVFVLVGVFTVVLLNYQSEMKVKAAVAELEQFVKDGKRTEALNRIDELKAKSPAIAADARVQKILAELAADQQEEDTRGKDFRNAMELVKKSIEDDLPDEKALAQAKRLAKTSDDKNEIEKAELDFKKIGEKKINEIDKTFLAQVKELRQRVDEIEKKAEASPDDSVQKLEQVTAELTKLESANGQITDAAKQRSAQLRDRIKSIEDDMSTIAERLKLEDAITDACGHPAALKDSMQKYADKFPRSRRSESFRAVLAKEPPLWDWIDQWNAMVQSVGRTSAATVNRKSAAETAARVRKLLDVRTGHPDAEGFRQRLPYLDAVVGRTDRDGNPIEAALRPAYTDPLVAGAWQLKDNSGKTYYLLEDPMAKFGGAIRPERTYGFEYVTGFDLAKKRKSLPGSELKNEDTVASQRKTGKALTGILDQLTDDNWEPSFCRMIDTVLKDDRTSPLLRHFLLRKTVEVGCHGSLCMEKSFQGAQQIFKSSAVSPTVNWVDPENSEADSQRPSAETELANLERGFAAAQNETAKQWKSLGASIGSQYTCVGWLRKDPAGGWQCKTKEGSQAAGKLAVVTIDEKNANAAAFTVIGRIAQGKAVIEASSGPALAEGRPVFVVVPP